MIEIGRVNNLVVNRETKSGYYLIDIDSDEEVFMPPALALDADEMKQNTELEAFVYVDDKDNLIATVQIPIAQVGEYAIMRVVESQEFGAFMDWGIDKDLLVPGNEQKFDMIEFEEHLVRVCLEPGTDRLFGTTKINEFIDQCIFDIDEQDEVKLMPFHKTDLGYQVVVNKKFIGMIYHNEIFTDIQIGEEYNGVVKKIRKDGRVDAALQAQGIRNLVDSKDIVLDVLNRSGGHTTVYDKSSPEEIRDMFGMSKKTFKAAVGMLYKERKITISKEGLKLVSKAQPKRSFKK